MEQIWETREQETMAQDAEKNGCDGLMRGLKTRGLIQITHLISVERYDDARKVVDVLERVKAI